MDGKTEKAEKIALELTDLEREYSATPMVSAVFGAFVLYIAHNCPEVTELKGILAANKVSPLLHDVLSDRIGGHWDRYRSILTSYSKMDLADFFSVVVTGERLANDRKLELASSSPIIDLVVRLLGPKAGDSVCDLGCAAGDFLCGVQQKAALEGEKIDLTGIELSSELAALAEMRMHCEGVEAKISNKSMFDRSLRTQAFDCVFCDAPMAVKGLPQDDEVRKFVSKAFPDFPELSAAMQGDWLFAARAVAALKKDGRAAVVLSPSAIFDGRNEAYRRYFIQRNLIEAVIELPPRLFTRTNVSTYLVVFGSGNEQIKMIRAGDLCYPNRKSNVIGKMHVDVVAACLGRSSSTAPEGLEEYCVVMDKDALLRDGCDLSVNRRFAEPEAVKNGQELGSFVLTARRGASVSSGELDEWVSESETSYLYLAPGDINDGTIGDELLHLNRIPEKYGSYVAHKDDLVITRVMASGADFKVAVVDVPEGKTVLPNGNLLVISVDPEKSDPYFIKACLDSAYAQSYLANNSVGSAVRTLSYKNLEKLVIPNIPLARQREIGAVCREKVRRVVALRGEYLKEKRMLATALNDLAGECLTRR